MHTSAFLEGYNAFKLGLEYKDNPYNFNPFVVFHNEWRDGWLSAYYSDELFS